MGSKTARKKKNAAERRKAEEEAKKKAQETDKQQREETTTEETASKVPCKDQDQNPNDTRRAMNEGDETPTKTNKDHTKYTNPNNKFSLCNLITQPPQSQLTFLAQTK